MQDLRNHFPIAVQRAAAAMPPRTIRDFFKPYLVPKENVPINTAVEEEIIVASPRRTAASRIHAGNIDDRQKLGLSQKAPRLSRQSSAQSTTSTRGGHDRSRDSSIASTPSKRTPRRSPQKRSVIAAFDGAADANDLLHSSPTPSTQRRLTAVEVPSPKMTPRPTPTLAPQKAAPAPEAASRATTSFSSISTLSSVPFSSQSSSRRIVKNGLHAVTNSDSGSADSDEELEDLDSFMPRKKARMTPPGTDVAHAIEIPSTVKPARQSARLSDKGSVRSGRSTPRLPPSPPRTAYKHSLLQMVKQDQKRVKQDARIAEAEAAVAEAERKKEAQAASAQRLDGTMMAEAMADDSDEGARMMQAMARTEALQNEERFHFFTHPARLATRDAFPTAALPDKGWAKSLRDDRSRAQACLTGFVADVAAKGLLSADMTTWFARQLLHESREELCEAYVEIIRVSTEHRQTVDFSTLCSTPGFYHTTSHASDDADQQDADAPMTGTQESGEDDHISCLCGNTDDDGSLVACDSCGNWQHTTCYYPEQDGEELSKDLQHYCIECKPQQSIDVVGARRRQKRRAKQRQQQTSSPNTSQRPEEVAPGLRYVSRVLQYCAPLAGAVGVGQAICDLALANIDDRVKGNVSLRFIIQDAIEALCETVAPSEADALYEHVKTSLLEEANLSMFLQCRVVASLPATSVQIHQLRRRLALYLITHSHTAKPLTSDSWPRTLLKRLRTAPEFSITDTTNYALLCSLTETLDIAIDAGFSSDFTFHTNPQQEQQPSKPAPGLFGRPAVGPLPAEQAFNAHIDALATQLRLMASRIRDAGATHLRRTEAKSALERLVVRLGYSVRTRPKAKRGVFSGGGGASELRGGLEGFVRRGVEGQVEKEEREKDESDAVPVDMLSGGDAVGGAEAVHSPALSGTDTKSFWDLNGAVRL